MSRKADAAAFTPYEERLFVSVAEAMGRPLTDADKRLLVAEWPVYGREPQGTFARRPSSVLRRWLTLMPPPALAELMQIKEGMSSVDALGVWCLFVDRGHQWLVRQKLIYPDIARAPDLLWAETTYGEEAVEEEDWMPIDMSRYGRRVEYDVMDEWTLLPTTSDTQLTHGELGDAGDAAQHAGLYWEDGQGLALSRSDRDAVAVDPAVPLRMSLSNAIGQLAATTATV